MNRKQFLAMAAGVGVVTTSAAAQDAVQWRVEDGGNGHWYQFQANSFRQTWHAARDSAHSVGAHLATISSEDEDDFIRSILPAFSDESGGQAWLGAFQDRTAPDYSEPFGGWRWVTGEPMTYQAWQGGGSEFNYPGADFLTLARQKTIGYYFWNDIQADYFGGRFFAIKEFDADCNSDGIVDYGQILAGELEDLNSNGVPDCCDVGTSCEPCPADIDGNGTVNGIDLAIILDKWGTDGGKDYPNADIDGDGTINGPDLANVLGSWGSCP